MNDSYYGPRLKKKTRNSIIGPSEQEVEKLLKNCAKSLGVEYKTEKKELTQEQKEMAELKEFFDSYKGSMR